MKILFACDLDNTLIHSYKYRADNDICVEIYDGREQSFISPKALELLKKISAQVFFVPITTRSIAQYKRIFWTEDFSPKCAFVANGAVFLDGDKQIFYRDAVAPYQDELKAQLAVADKNIFTIARLVDESFLFLRCRDDLNPAEITFQTNLTVQYTGKKIYLFPPDINKGAALKILIKKFLPDKIICAGDSIIDLPMLQLADIAFAHENLRGKNFIAFSNTEEFLEKIYRALCNV